MHGLARSVEWRLIGRLALGSIPATVVTIYLLSLPDRRVRKPQRLSPPCSGRLALTAISLLFRDSIVREYRKRIGELTGQQTTGFTIATGVVLGVLVSVSSVGAGALGVTALLLLYPHLPMVRIVGSDIAHAVPLTLVAGIGHWLVGNVDWLLLGSKPQ